MARKAWGHKLQLRLCIVLSPWKVPHNLQIAIWKHVDTKVWVICWTNKLAAEAWVAPPQRRCGSSKPQLLLNEQKECVSGAGTKIAAQCRKHTIILWGRWKSKHCSSLGQKPFSANFQLRKCKMHGVLNAGYVLCIYLDGARLYAYIYIYIHLFVWIFWKV